MDEWIGPRWSWDRSRVVNPQPEIRNPQLVVGHATARIFTSFLVVFFSIGPALGGARG
jgi:hypothetical protein